MTASPVKPLESHYTMITFNNIAIHTSTLLTILRPVLVRCSKYTANSKLNSRLSFKHPCKARNRHTSWRKREK